MSQYIIEGGRPLSGVVRPSGNKNEVLPAIVACLLTDETVVLHNVPRIRDVITLCEILQSLGVAVEWFGEDTLELNASKCHSYKPDRALCAHIRASILLLGPLLARFGNVELPPPGGDVIGSRRIDTHFEGITHLGAKLEYDTNIRGSLTTLHGGDIFLDEPSVTATENLLLLASHCEESVTLHNAASEPHVVGLCRMLQKMGVKIEGIGSNLLMIQGSKQLSGCSHDIGPDFMEVGSFLALGAISGGHITIEGIRTQELRFILKVFERIGIDVTIDGSVAHVKHTGNIAMKKDIGGRVGTIYSAPWPGFPTDLMSITIVAATQARGTMIFFEKMFEGRMFFTDKLMAMGANIVLCDPHRIVVNGPSQLYGAHVTSPDVRAGMAVLMAALVAQGKSTIDNVYQIERGYHKIAEKLTSLGAAITRVEY